eukprot:scaffold211046_cov19-Prasinocladus_malaysianus.AAC.1
MTLPMFAVHLRVSADCSSLSWPHGGSSHVFCGLIHASAQLRRNLISHLMRGVLGRFLMPCKIRTAEKVGKAAQLSTSHGLIAFSNINCSN